MTKASGRTAHCATTIGFSPWVFCKVSLCKNDESNIKHMRVRTEDARKAFGDDLKDHNWKPLYEEYF